MVNFEYLDFGVETFSWMWDFVIELTLLLFFTTNKLSILKLHYQKNSNSMCLFYSFIKHLLKINMIFLIFYHNCKLE